MTNRLIIEIDAKSNVQAIVDKVTKAFGRLDRTASKSSRDGGLHSLDKRVQGIENSIRGVSSAFNTLLPGAGAFLTGSGLVMGITRWAQFGTTVVNTAHSAGLSTRKMQALRGAADLAGVDADSAAQSFDNLGQSLQDAFYGRNQQVLAAMNARRLAIKRLANGNIDVANSIYDIADATRELERTRGVNAARTFLRALGMEDMLPLLRRGRAGVQGLEQQYLGSDAAINAERAADMDRKRKAAMNVATGWLNKVWETMNVPDLGARGASSEALRRYREIWGSGSAAYATARARAERLNRQLYPQSWGGPSDFMFGAALLGGAYPGGGAPERRNPPGRRGGFSEAEARRRLAALIPGLRITGGGRSAARNAEVGGVDNSMHLSREALDFVVAGMANPAVQRRLRQKLVAAGLPISESFYEGRRGNQGPHMHWGWRGARGSEASPLASRDFMLADTAARGAGAQPQARVVLDIRGAPPGSSVRVTSQHGITIEPRIEHSLAPGVSP